MNQGIPVNQVNGTGAVNNRVQQAPQQQQHQQHQQHQSQQPQPQPQQQAQQSPTHPQQAPQQQQRQPTQQQLQRQRHQILFQKLKGYKFAETTEDLAKKYASLPPSLEFHIYDNHFRFGQQDGIIPKSSPLGKEFLRYILREEIPDSLVEVIKDAGIQLYEGCIILNVIDHRNLVEKIVKTEGEDKVTQQPKSYRTVLKPSQISIYADLLYQTDSAQLRLSDQSSLLLEAEILTLTKRNVDLSVPLNPYNCNDYLRPEIESSKYIPEKDVIVHQHRVNDEMYQFKPLHEDSVTSHHNQSEYEQMMSLFSENYRSSNNSVNLMNESSSSQSSQFVRLRFIENYRRKLERMKATGIATSLQNKVSGEFSNGNGQNGNGLGSISNMLGITPQQRVMIQQQRMIQQQQKVQMSNALNGGRANSNAGAANQSSPSATNLNGNDKKKPATKRPRKQPTKKQQAAAAAAAQAAAAGLNLNDSVVSTPESGEPPTKKKRGTYKKKNKNANNDQQDSSQQLQQQQHIPQQQQQQQQQQAPSNIMDMNFSMMGGFPQ